MRRALHVSSGVAARLPQLPILFSPRPALQCVPFSSTADAAPLGKFPVRKPRKAPQPAPEAPVADAGAPAAPAEALPASGYRGATLDKKSGKWRAVITVNKKRIDLGLFDEAKLASDAYFAAKAIYADQMYQTQRKRVKKEDGGEDVAMGASGPAEAGKETSAAAAPAVPAPPAVPALGAVSKVRASSAVSQPVASSATVKPAPSLAQAVLGGEDDDEDEEDDEPVWGLPEGAPNPVTRSSKYIGVLQEGERASMWEAVIHVNGRDISGGEYDTQEEAARAYDALARMYLGPDAQTNFPLDAYVSWAPPDESVVHTGQIETKLGVPLTVEEVMRALEQERGINVRVLPLAGRSDLADYMVFVTGRSASHMRKMADTIARALRKRRLPGIDSLVEARDMDDWMVVDAGNIIVNVMDEVAREAFDLERFYETMKANQDPWEGLTFDQWLAANPVPQKWLERLEQDADTLEREQTAPAAPPVPKQ